jgi:mono/diheme cytochrome c family protein
MEACSPASGNKTGHEFMPDMVHSTAVEANIYNYYFYNTWGDEASYKELINPRKPVTGTIPRGMSSVYYSENMADRVGKVGSFAGTHFATEMAIPVNGSAPYYYEDNDAERLRAINEIIDNPFPISDNGLERGEELYVIYCGICHGDKADGNGYLVREANPAAGDLIGGLYPAAPANMLQPQFIDTTNGLYYHAIMYGKNVMGGYADKLSYEERWQVIHYIRSLQAKERKLKYDETENSLNTTSTTLASIADQLHKDHEDEGEHSTDEAEHEEEAHGEESDGHGH